MAEYKLTDEGKKYLKQGLPEENLAKLLRKGPVGFNEAKNKIENFAIAMQWVKKKGWVEVRDGKLSLVKYPEQIEEEEALKKIAAGKQVDENVLKILMERNLVERITETHIKTEVGLAKHGNVIDKLNRDIIITGLWRGKKFRPVDIGIKKIKKIERKKITFGKKHFATIFLEKVRRIFLDMGFREVAGSLVESGFWNFDALFQPQDHPARDMQDTFYMKTPAVAKLPDKKIVERVKATHENGWTTGSIGWRYNWSEQIAKQTILRTHTTAVTCRSLNGIKLPAKIFCVGKVFRNETIDYKHLPEFAQVEGIVVDENVCFRDLLGYLKEFYSKMGFDRIRFVPSYFPYTEMSTEVQVYFEDRKEWLEMGGSGIFRPEVTEPLGVKAPVLAWGLGFERPIMLRLVLNDIRNFYYKNDIQFLRSVKE